MSFQLDLTTLHLSKLFIDKHLSNPYSGTSLNMFLFFLFVKFNFILVLQVLDMHAYEARQKEYALKGHKHFYFMTLNGSEVRLSSISLLLLSKHLKYCSQHITDLHVSVTIYLLFRFTDSIGIINWKLPGYNFASNRTGQGYFKYHLTDGHVLAHIGNVWGVRRNVRTLICQTMLLGHKTNSISVAKLY